MLDLKRRQFITLLGGAAAAWPLAARAQQPAMPVVGFIHAGSAATSRLHTTAFRQGLNESGYVEGRNVTIEYRWAEGRPDQYPKLVADLIRQKVNVIATGANTPASRAAKAATSTIPIVFGVGDDPVKLGLVASLARPGGNATGVNFFIAELAAKRLGLLREMLPGAARMAVLVNPANKTTTESTVKDVETAAPTLGLQIQIFHADTAREIDAAYASLVRQRFDALFVGPSPFFNTRRVQLAIAAARHAVPTVFAQRDYAEVGGLVSYGANISDTYRQVGVYTGRILKGEKPTDLPVVQSTKFELVINAQTARTLGLTVPPSLLAIADEVIE
jgi:putative tryptophan/tyrosine transport system substrate-binding protein